MSSPLPPQPVRLLRHSRDCFQSKAGRILIAGSEGRYWWWNPDVHFHGHRLLQYTWRRRGSGQNHWNLCYHWKKMTWSVWWMFHLFVINVIVIIIINHHQEQYIKSNQIKSSSHTEEGKNTMKEEWIMSKFLQTGTSENNCLKEWAECQRAEWMNRCLVYHSTPPHKDMI